MLLEKIYDRVGWMEQMFGLSGLLTVGLSTAFAVAATAYLMGCFNGAVIVSKYILRDDVRNHGSGNAGLTNFYRTFGGGLTAVVILCDIMKAIIAVWIGSNIVGGLIGHNDPHMILVGKYWAGLFCMFGHMFPCMFEFKGGKGVLSGGAIAIMIDWRIALVVWGGFIVLFLLTRYVSLGSIWAGFSFPFVTWFVFHDIFTTITGMIMGWMLVYLHRGNIQRLLTGTERKFTFNKKK